MSWSVRIALVYTALFTSIGVFVPFWPVWLKERGLTDSEIGLLLAVSQWVRLLGTPLLAQHADRSGTARGMLVVCSFVSMAIFTTFLFVTGFVGLLVVTIIYSVFATPLVPLLDAVTLAGLATRRATYGRLRMFGSASFAISAAAAGEFLTGRSKELVPWMILACLVLCCVTTLLTPKGEVRSESPVRHPVRMLLRDRRFIAAIVGAGLIHASHALYYGFSTLHWRAAGISSGAIGALWAVAVMAEIVFFWFGGRWMHRLQISGMLLVAALCAVVRWVGTGSTTDLTMLFLLQPLHAMTFGMTHAAVMHCILNEVPRGMATSAQSLYAAIASGIGMGLATLLSGPLYERLQGSGFFWMAALAAVCLIAVGVRHLSRSSGGSG